MNKNTHVYSYMSLIGLSLGVVLFASTATGAEPKAYMPMTLVNQSGFDDQDVYFIMKAMDPLTNKDCFLSFDLQTGEGDCEVVSKTTTSDKYSYSFAQIHNNKLKIPKVYSGRIYFSVGYPVLLHVNSSDEKIIDTDGFKARDQNYYTLHDKVEFSYVDAGSWINPTAVDFFSLPIRIEQPGAATPLKAAGIEESFEDIFEILHEIVSENDTTQSSEWEKLFLYFDAKNGVKTPLRFVSPGKAMVQGVPGTNPFDLFYLNNPAVYGFDYIDSLWEYYTWDDTKQNTLIIDASEIKSFFALDDYIFTGHVEGNEFVFSNKTNTYVERIQKPTTSMPFFAGDGAEFAHSNNTPKAIMVRQITSAFTVGLLPAPSGTVLDKAYFESRKQDYYSVNPLWPQTSQGPWYDLYGDALHSFGHEQAIYTFAYDDALGQDGTLHDPNSENIAEITVTLEDMQNVSIPDPYTDDTLYTVTVYIGENSVVEYNGQTLKSGQILNNVPIPFTATLNGNLANIYIQYPIVKPYFEGADGIVINQTGNTSAEVIFPGK